MTTTHRTNDGTGDRTYIAAECTHTACTAEATIRTHYNLIGADMSIVHCDTHAHELHATLAALECVYTVERCDTFMSEITHHPIPFRGTYVDRWDNEATFLECDHGQSVNADVYHNGVHMFCIAVDNRMGHTCNTAEWMECLTRILQMDA